MAKQGVIGFVGLGVMGEPMCRHLATKSGSHVLGYDLDSTPLERLAQHGVQPAASLDDLFARATIVFVSLPSGSHLEGLCRGPGGALEHMREGKIFVDLGTSPLDLTRELAHAFAAKGVRYADAPVARTRKAAEAGTLALTVGATEALFAELEPLLACFASEVTHCGPVGSGQVVKILNNMVVVETVIALSEAAAIARSAGIEPERLFQTFAKASADSFALRNHGLNAIAANQFPERVFSTEYMLKDIGYALRMAEDAGISARGADYGRELLERAAVRGRGAAYWPVISTLLNGAAAQTNRS